MSSPLSRVSRHLADVVALLVLVLGVWGMVDRDLRLLFYHFLAVGGLMYLLFRQHRVRLARQHGVVGDE